MLVITNQKGGVGKTTLTLALLHFLPKRGLKVLGVDLDPQANLTLGVLGSFIEEDGYNSYHLLKKLECIPRNLREFDFIPSSIELAKAEAELISAPAREFRLSKALQKVKDEYDVVLVDTPPSLGVITLNALFSANGVVVPVELSLYGLAGLGHLFKVLEEVEEFVDRKIPVLGLVPNLYERNSVLHNEVLKELEKLPYKVFPPIPKRSLFRRVVSYGEEFNKVDKATAESLEKLIEEVVRWVKESP